MPPTTNTASNVQKRRTTGSHRFESVITQGIIWAGPAYSTIMEHYRIGVMIADLIALWGVLIGVLQDFETGVLLIGAALVWTIGRYTIYST